jgi:hypothetical protein
MTLVTDERSTETTGLQLLPRTFELDLDENSDTFRVRFAMSVADFTHLHHKQVEQPYPLRRIKETADVTLTRTSYKIDSLHEIPCFVLQGTAIILLIQLSTLCRDLRFDAP